MTKTFFTFGHGHVDGEGNSLANNYVEIHADTHDNARDKMFKEYGPKFAFEYRDEKKFNEQIKRFNLIRHELINLTL